MAVAVPYLIGASTLMSVAGAIEEGEAAEQAAELKAKTAMATSTREAAESKRAGEIVKSGARAAMAAGGGSAADPGAMETIGKIESEAQYNALTSLYEGQQTARLAEYEGRLKKKAAYTKGLSTILSGSASTYSAYQKYNP